MQMESQIHYLEQVAYSSVLRAFKAQSDALSWEKEGLITELRKELRVSDDEHRELLSDDIIIRIREGKGAVQKKVNALRELRRLLSKSGAIPLLAQCLSFGSQDEQLLEAAWCLTNIAAGKPEETRALLPALPLLIAYIGEKSSVPVAEQCAWAIGNVAGEGDELRQILISQGTLLPLAKMMLPNKGSTGPDPKAATELIKVDGVVEAILRHLRKSVLVKTDVLQLLVERLMLIPQLEALVGRHSRPLTFWIGSQQKKQCFQQAEEHCSKAISLDKKVSCLYYFCKKLVMLLT
ncbi:hypothetical protein LXL04_006550 [Taraxacum kok-saghyz]